MLALHLLALHLLALHLLALHLLDLLFGLARHFFLSRRLAHRFGSGGLVGEFGHLLGASLALRGRLQRLALLLGAQLLPEHGSFEHLPPQPLLFA